METILACLTPPGKAAIAVIGVRGPLAWSISRQLFAPRTGSLPEQPAPGRFWLGKIGLVHGDDAILAVKEDGIELHCHGGVEVVRMIEQLYRERGAKPVCWNEFAGSEILDLLAHAPTARTAAVLLDQADGAWERWWAEMDVAEPARRMEMLHRLDALTSLGRHLVEPWRIAIAGAPNVGKSSLVNALAGYARSVISPVPGTTRDVVTVRLAIDGWPVELIDTAGIRAAPGELERVGIERALIAILDADLRFWVLDGSATPVYPENRAGWHFLINKIDLPAAWDWDEEASAGRTSARTRAGLTEWCAAISRQLVPKPPVAGEAVPGTKWQIEWVEKNRSV